MTRLSVYAIICVVAIVFAFAAGPDSVLFEVALGLALGFGVPLVDAAVTTGRKWKLVWYCLRYYRSDVRLSVSYLVRIHLGNEYLLVFGNRWQQFQPVGGVYKFHPGSLDSFNARNDNLVPLDPVSDGDLRVRIKGRHLYGFANWFESGVQREAAPWREFQEELIGSGLLDAQEFAIVICEFVSRVYRPMRYSSWAQSREMFIADIYDLVPSAQQAAALRSVPANYPDRAILATEEQIRRRGVVVGSPATVKIAETAQWIIDLK